MARLKEKKNMRENRSMEEELVVTTTTLPDYLPSTHKDDDLIHFKNF